MSKCEYQWIPKKVNYDLERVEKVLKSQKMKFTDYHPLKPILVTESSAIRGSRRKQSDGSSSKSSSSSTQMADFIDPLSALSGSDPLSSVSAAVSVVNSDDAKSETGEENKNSEYGEDFEDWSRRRIIILNKYTTDEKLSMEMISMLKNDKEQSRSTGYSVSVADKLRSRLCQLDDLAEGSVKEMKNLDQQEFIKKIRILGNNLRQAWDANQKVNALKIVIQSAKMLADSSVMLYYPSKFVLIAEILDMFGNLVFSRILSMCGVMSADDIDPDKVPENAREICTNWMLKIASIRELLPRIYVEACILPCYNFIKRGECNSVLVRLTNMTRGVGNPLIAVYIRTYLCMTGVKHSPKFKGHLASNFYDYVSTYKQIHTTSVQNDMSHQRMDTASYLSLYTPALEWILSCLAYKAHEGTLKDVLEKCCKTGSSLLMLQCILASFKSDYISTRSMELCSIISESQDNLFPKTTVYCTLGLSVCIADPPDQDKLPLLNEIWKFIIKIQKPEDYITCAEVWTEYAVKNFKKREITTVLGDIIKHMIPDRAFEKFYSKLQSIVRKILTHMTDFSLLFSMDKFLPFLDLFQKESVKLDVCKCIGEFFIRGSESSTSDPLVISGLMYLCKAMHNSINSLSLEGERKSASNVICGVIQKVTFGRDFEQQLSFYVECRASFRNLDQVLATLVHLVNSLSVKASRIVRRNHTTKTAAFVRACSAYCFITIPSLSDIFLRLSLYLASGQAALISHCITQADAMFCAAVSQTLDMSTRISAVEGKNVSSQNILVSYISNFLSTLLVVPDHPEQGVLYLLRGLVNVVSGVGDNASPLTTDSCIIIYIKVLSLLTAYSQEKYLYQVDSVDSNANLYSSNDKFLEEISSIGTTLLDEILAYLSAQNLKQDHSKVSSSAFELFSTILAHGNLEDDSMKKLASSTWALACHGGQANTKLMGKFLDSLNNRGGLYSKIAANLEHPTIAY